MCAWPGLSRPQPPGAALGPRLPGDGSSLDQSGGRMAIFLCPVERRLREAGRRRGLLSTQPRCQTEAGDRWNGTRASLALLLLPEAAWCQIAAAQTAARGGDDPASSYGRVHAGAGQGTPQPPSSTGTSQGQTAGGHPIPAVPSRATTGSWEGSRS